ncbi:TonB-dependent receptor [Dysgonomonas sp. HDW5A]|uniref:TonB-dependent receptor n=1 Tax=Dysgonomonas sp. HDW5A TaxID=2714926 RepID=UPI0014098976|nr:TonB-dependent receptor [Dysgonomonas sp. HDW5A]QIK59747.1 TonB-dependent receptor [Dysgonomonas sp. HDW5A]
MKKMLFYFLMTVYSSYLFSQRDHVSVMGSLIDATNTPIEYANVSLLSKDSTYILGGNSTSDGQFRISPTSQGDYIVKVSYVGYQDTYINVPQLMEKRDIGIVVLQENTHNLKEIEVTADRVINKVDRQITLPTDFQIKNSVQGIDLLNKMAIPEIAVDPVNRTVIATDGGSVQIRINGVRVSSVELMGVKADDVLRVETYNALGARFGGEDATVIIDVILKQKKTGGYVMTDLMNAPFVGFGDNLVVTKMNYKDSQFGALYYLSYRDYKDRFINRKTEFNNPDDSFYRQQDGIKTPFNYQTHNVNFSYNLRSSDKYLLNVEFRNEILNVNNNYRSRSYYSNTGLTTFNNTLNRNSRYSPTLDLFFKYNLSKKQSLMTNIVGTYIKTNNKRDYKEYDDEVIFVDISNRDKGNKYSLITEVVYENQFNDKLGFSTGINHTQGYIENTIIQATAEKMNLRNTNTYLFSQLQGTIQKFNYSLGVGITRIWFNEAKNGFTFYAFRPSLQLAYKAKDNLAIRYNFSIESQAPSLGQLNGVDQRVDSIQISRGNPNLRPYNLYNNILTLSFSRNNISANLNFRYNYFDSPIMDVTYLENDMYINTYANQNNLVKYGVFANMKIQLIKDIWSIGVTGGVDRFHSQSSTYSHYHTAYWGNINTNASYKKFDLNFAINFRTSSLWGEIISYGEDWQSIDLGYRYRAFRFGAGMSYPFKSEWSAGYKNLSKIRTENSWTYIPDNGHMLFLRFSWDVSFGKKYQSVSKSLNNSDRDTGIRGID